MELPKLFESYDFERQFQNYQKEKRQLFTKKENNKPLRTKDEHLNARYIFIKFTCKFGFNRHKSVDNKKRTTK